MEVADGGAVGVLEGGGVHGFGSAVERQRLAFAVERSLEGMHSARHHRDADVIGEFYSLAAEAVQSCVILHTLAEVVPPVGVLDGVGVTVLREVGVRRERERGAKGHILIGHGECVGVAAIVGDAVSKA